MSRHPHRARKPPKLAAWLRCALILVQAVLFALTFQVSGLAEAIVVSVDSCADELSSCPLEKQGEECPPHCPQCHCVHVNGLAAPASQLVLVSSAAVGRLVGLDEPESVFIASPLRANPYRPPRSVARA